VTLTYVVGCSLIIDALSARKEDEVLRRRLSAPRTLHAPHHLDVEVASTVRGLAAGKKVTDRRGAQMLADYARLRITRRVSGYQYYEFRALDRRLTAEQQQRLRSLSSRADISATRLANEYSFGNFRGDPGRLLEEYFDAYLYAANWGTRELAFRLPRALLDAETARRYCDEEHRAWVTETAEHVIVRFRWDDDEGDDWIEGDGLLDPLLDARSELAAGDLRLLYLGWLLKIQLGGPDEDDEEEGLGDEAEPPVPAGLKQLSGSLASVTEFLKIDDDLIAVAAKASRPLVPVSDDGIADWVTGLPASEKDKYLTMVADGEGAQVEALLVRRFRQESLPTATAAASAVRTARDLLDGAEARRAARKAAEARAREEARARQAAEQAAARERHLEQLARLKDETWQQVEKLTMFSKPKEYDQATQLLRDLHEIARREDDITAFTTRVRKLRTRYAKRPSLMERFDKAGLPQLG
jgi:predicted nucleic acid-binding protein